MLTALLVAFVLMLILKLAEIIDWSWWIVCLPLYLDIILAIVVWCLGGTVRTIFTFGQIFRERAKFKRAMKTLEKDDIDP